jgi:hypothetical protein
MVAEKLRRSVRQPREAAAAPRQHPQRAAGETPEPYRRGALSCSAGPSALFVCAECPRRSREASLPAMRACGELTRRPPRRRRLHRRAVAVPSAAGGGYDDRAAVSDSPDAYPRPAYTPPTALETPLPSRPAAAGFEAAGFSAAAPHAAELPTPMPPARPSAPPPGAHARRMGGRALCMPCRKLPCTLLVGQLAQSSRSPQPPSLLGALAGPAVGAAPATDGPDDPSFDARWAANLEGLRTGSLAEVVEHMKQLCADIMVATGENEQAGGAGLRQSQAAAGRREAVALAVGFCPPSVAH